MKQIFSPRLMFSTFFLGTVLLFISCSKEPFQTFKEHNTVDQPPHQVKTTSKARENSFCSTGFDYPYGPPSKTIPTGFYYIKSMVNPALNLVLDVPSGIVQNGVIVQQYTYHGGHNQRWWVQWVSGDYYTISIAPHGQYLWTPRYYLDVPNGAPRPGLKIQLYEWPKDALSRWEHALNQQWWISVTDGFGQIFNRRTLLPLGVPNRSTTSGVQIEQSLIFFGNWQFIKVPLSPSTTKPGCTSY